MVQPTRLKSVYVLRVSNVLSYVLSTSGRHQFTYYQNEIYLVLKNNSTYHEVDKGAAWYRVYPLLAQIEMTMRTSVLVQQFTHLFSIPITSILEKKFSRLWYLLWKIADKTEKQTQKKTSKQYTRQDIRLDIKVMVSLSTPGVKLLTLLGSPFCHPLLVSLFRWSSVLLASSSLLGSSCLFRRLPRRLVEAAYIPALCLCS